jgi:enamine deaminase RidA (YjgF/YER057c/UK114 family)
LSLPGAWFDGFVQRQDIDPRYFGNQLGYNRAVLIEQPRRWLMVAGHEARADDGSIAAPGDMVGQLEITVQRLDETLQKSGFALSDVVQIRIFTVDLATMKQNYGVLLNLLARANCRPTSLLAEVSGLSDPAMLVEIEAVAAQ